MSRWQDILGFENVEGPIRGTTTAAAKCTVSRAAPRTDVEAVPRVTNEYVDQPNPHSMLGDPSDDNLGDSSRTEDASVDHDGYGGRGTGKKDVDASYTDR
jgi:hypothetical protein